MHLNHLNHLNSSLLFGLAGSLFVVLALPLIAKLVKPNKWYGFRVEKTLSSAQIWYEANRIVGIDLLMAGLTIIGTAVLTYLAQGRSSAFPSLMVNLAVLVVALLASFTHSWLALQRIK